MYHFGVLCFSLSCSFLRMAVQDLCFELALSSFFCPPLSSVGLETIQRFRKNDFEPGMNGAVTAHLGRSSSSLISLTHLRTKHQETCTSWVQFPRKLISPDKFQSVPAVTILLSTSCGCLLSLLSTFCLFVVLSLSLSRSRVWLTTDSSHLTLNTYEPRLVLEHSI